MIVDLEARDLKPLGAPVIFHMPSIASDWAGGPPLAWLDDKTLALIRTEAPRNIPDETSGSVMLDIEDQHINYLCVADIASGKIRDFAPVPGVFATTLLDKLREPKPFAPAIMTLNVALS